MSKKNFDFYGLDGAVVRKSNLICNNNHTAYGDEYVTYQLSQDELNIEFKNEKNIGLISNGADTQKDLICSLMEILPDSPKEKILEFFNSYGFFFYSKANAKGIYTNYHDSDIRKLIEHLRKLVELNNIYVKYLNHIERKNAGYNDVLNIDYTNLCNTLLNFYYDDAIYLEESINNESLNKTLIESILQDTNTNDIYHLGNDYVHNYLSTCKTNNIDLTVCPQSSPSFPRSQLRSHIKREFIEEETENIFLIYLFAQTEMIYFEPYRSIFSELSEAEKTFSDFCIDLFNHDLLYCKNRYLSTTTLNLPTVLDFNDETEKNVGFQKRLMDILSLVINDQINMIIKNIKPYVTDVIIDNHISSEICFKNENLLCLIMIELAELKKRRIECRACCKPDCPEKGKYYFLANVNDLQSTCYDKKCRIRINKKKFDAKHK